MTESQQLGVQCLAPQPLGKLHDVWRTGHSTVKSIGEKRRLQLLAEMNPDLMRSTRLQPAPNVGCSSRGQRLNQFEVRNGLLALLHQ
jgi:hypothetical protein